MPKLTVGQLRELIEDLNDETEVRWLSQPSWPFEWSIDGAATSEFLLDRKYWDLHRSCMNGDSDELILDDSQALQAQQDGYKVHDYPTRGDSPEDVRMIHIAGKDMWLKELIDEELPEEGVLYLAEGSQLGYAKDWQTSLWNGNSEV